MQKSLNAFCAAAAAVALSMAALPMPMPMPAMAADLGSYRPTVEPVDTSPPVRLAPWRGFYVGVNGGYAWGDSGPVVVSDGINASTLDAIDPSGFLGGGQIGYNAQFGNFVIGAEADIQGGNIDGSSSISAGGNTVAFSNSLNWLATVRGRAGFATNSVLIYATGGVAWADVDSSISVNGLKVSASDTGTGYVVGGDIVRQLR